MIFNQRIRLLRDEKRLTQEDAARELGISPRNYQRLEADGAVPSYQSLVAIGEYYDVSLDFLVGRTEHREVNR